MAVVEFKRVRTSGGNARLTILTCLAGHITRLIIEMAEKVNILTRRASKQSKVSCDETRYSMPRARCAAEMLPPNLDIAEVELGTLTDYRGTLAKRVSKGPPTLTFQLDARWVTMHRSCIVPH